MWDETTYPLPNFNGFTVEVWEWICNFIPYFTGYVITYPCWDWSSSMSVKGARGDLSCCKEALDRSLGVRIHIITARQSHDSLIFIMWIPLQGKMVLILKQDFKLQHITYITKVSHKALFWHKWYVYRGISHWGSVTHIHISRLGHFWFR